jgi:cell division topological specificity factor
VLVHDRMKVSPELLELIKSELLTVISRRLEVDEQHMQISMARESGWDKLLADVPVKRQKVSFEWDPPAHTPSTNVMRGKLHIEDVEV